MARVSSAAFATFKDVLMTSLISLSSPLQAEHNFSKVSTQTNVVSVFKVFHSLKDSKGEPLEGFFSDASTGPFAAPSTSSVVFEGSEDHFLFGTVEDLGLGGIVGGGIEIPTTYEQQDKFHQ